MSFLRHCFALICFVSSVSLVTQCCLYIQDRETSTLFLAMRKGEYVMDKSIKLGFIQQVSKV